MGDSSCVVHAFSYASTEPKQGNHHMHHALGGESVSFGRFMSESLSWEKWSTFSHNRYVEEAERYARPGSVAQKKAFFEAHYKRIAAAKKAAALLEQAAAADDVPQATLQLNKPKEHAQESNVAVQVEIPVKDEKLDDANENLHNQQRKSGSNYSVPPKMEKSPLPLVEIPVSKENLLSSIENIDHPVSASASESSETPQMEKKPLLKNVSREGDVPSVNSRKKSAFSSFKSSICPKSPIVPSSGNKIDNNSTPITKKSTPNFTEKRRSQKSHQTTYINSTPDRLIAPSNAKTPNSKVVSASYKALQNCIRTPNTAASTKMSTKTSTTPQLDNDTTRVKSPAGASKSARPKWNILSTVYSKSLTACRNKLQSPTLSTPFTLRTEERAARRKQKLEEKFNLNETPKVQQLQTKIKEKAELELRKLRQNFCFKARPLPDFYKEKETTQIQMKKGTGAQTPSSKVVKNPTSSTISMAPSAKINKSSRHDSRSKSPTTARRFLASLTGATTTNHENTSPNIQ